MEAITDLTYILTAFAGGVFGAALGGLAAFILCGFWIVAGELIVIAGGPEVVTNQIGLGPFFGPHVAFCAGCIAAVYAYNKGYLETGLDILTPLVKFRAWDILLIGGIFGIAGHLLSGVLAQLTGITDTLALTIVILQIIGRIIWGKKGAFGQFKPHESDYKSRWSWGANKEAAWIPFQRGLGTTILIGLSVGLASGFMVFYTGSVLIGFGFSGFSLIILQLMGVGPVTHHMALVAALATAATGNIMIGGLFGILAAFVGDYLSRMFTDWGDSHIDPPALAISFCCIIVFVFL